MSRTTTGYIDPTLQPARTVQEQTIFDLVIRRGLTLHRLHAGTRAVRLIGPGIHVTAEGLHWIKPADFEPMNSDRARGY